MGVVESLLPVFLVIALGAVLTARGFLTPEFLNNLNRLAYYVGMPGLLFVSVSTASAIDERPFRIALVLFVASLVALGIGYALGRWLRVATPSMGTFVQSCFRSNLAFVGLPIVFYVFSLPGAPARASEMAPLVAMAIAPVMLSYNILAVIVLVASHEKLTSKSTRTIAWQVVTNPLVISIALGMVAARFGLHLPVALESTFRTLGGLAIPAALLGVGGTTMRAPVRENLRPALAAACVKVVAMPVFGYAVAHVLDLPPLDAALATMLCATPTAAVSFIMSVQLRGNAAIAASAIATSTLLSAATLAVTVSLLPPG